MKEGCERLQEVGAQKIHEDTHISRQHIQAVIHKSFDGLNKVQFLGFISILEREYNLDLTVLKNEGLAFFKEHTLEKPVKKGVFVLSNQEKKPTAIYMVLVLIILAVVAFFSLSDFASQETITPEATENKIIVKVKEDIQAIKVLEDNASDLNGSDTNNSATDLNLTTNVEINSSVVVMPEIIEPVKELQAFKIMPKSKVWIGYINRENYKKYQETIRKELALKRDKEWLLVLGHSHVTFNVNGEIKKFNASGNLYLHYKDGEIKKISLKEFKKLNRGRKW